MYKYQIKKIIKRNGDKIFVPMAKKTGIMHEWSRIINLYGHYELTTSYADTDFRLNVEDCHAHIEGHMKAVEAMLGDTVQEVEIIVVNDLKGVA